MKILLAVEPVDFRRGIDGLKRLCESVLKADPFSGGLFVFRNRKGTSIKILSYDSQGFYLFYKRLSAGRFTGWPKHGDDGICSLDVQALQILIWNGDPGKSTWAPAWKNIREK